MKKFIALLTAAVLTVFACAGCNNSKTVSSSDQSGTVTGNYRIGINVYAEHPSLDNCRLGFLEGLKQSGIEEGVNLTVDYQNAGGNNSTCDQISQSFSINNVDLMCGVATPSAQSCYAAAEDKDIPVVFVAVNDPESAKLVGGNITGSSDRLPVTAQLELIRKMQPDAQKIGIVYTLSESNSVSTIAEYKEAAPNYGFEIISAGVNTSSEVTIAVDKLIKDGVDCFSNLTDNNVVSVLSSVLEKTNDAKIPVYGSEIEQVKNGCVAAAGIDYVQLGIETGKLAAKILKGEAAASELPYISVEDFGKYVNKDVISELNMNISEDVLRDLTDVNAE